MIFYKLHTGLIVDEPEGVRPRDTYSPVALAVVIAIGVALLLFIVFFIAALVFGACRSRRQRRAAITSKFACDLCIYHIHTLASFRALSIMLKSY